MTFGATPILIQIDPDDGAFVGDIEVIYSKFSGGLSWDGDGFFYGSRRNVNSGGDNRIHRYDNAGNEIQVLDVPAGTVEPLGLAFDGRDLWVLATGSDEVYVMDPASGAIVRSFPLPGRAFIEITGGYLWAFDNPGGTRLLRKIVP